MDCISQQGFTALAWATRNVTTIKTPAKNESDRPARKVNEAKKYLSERAGEILSMFHLEAND
jgi:hypothetical protein